MTEKRDDDNTVERIFDLAQEAKELYDENKDLVHSVVPSSPSTVNLDSPDPMAEAHINDDEVIIVVEVDTSSGGLELKADIEDGMMNFNVAGESFVVDIPDDVVEESLDATINNGVLRATMDREQSESVGVMVKKEHDDEEKIEDGGDDNGTSE